MNTKKGKLIVFDGPDGCGKSTMHEKAINHLNSKGITPVIVRDPGSTDIGLKLRKILLDPNNDEMSSTTELMLYIASRAQLVKEIIAPSLDDGKIVLSDRFTLSTLVYQGIASKMSEDDMVSLIKYGLEGIYPDLMILFDVPTEVAFERIGTEQDRMEQKGLEFHKKVRQRYLNIGKRRFSDVICVINAENSIDKVEKDVLALLDCELGLLEI